MPKKNLLLIIFISVFIVSISIWIINLTKIKPTTEKKSSPAIVESEELKSMEKELDDPE